MILLNKNKKTLLVTTQNKYYKMIQKNQLSKAIPLSKTLGVLIGFPIIATIISLLLLNRPLITNLGLDFFNTFWLLITGWYLIQIYIVSKILHSEGWKWADIGFSFSKNRPSFSLVAIYFLLLGCLLLLNWQWQIQ